MGTEGAAAVKGERAGVSSGEAGEGVGVIGGSGVGTTGAATAAAMLSVIEADVGSGLSGTKEATGVAAGDSWTGTAGEAAATGEAGEEDAAGSAAWEV